MSDWKKDGIEHLERPGCIINIRAGLHDREGHEVTSIEILPASAWKRNNCCKNTVIKVSE